MKLNSPKMDNSKLIPFYSYSNTPRNNPIKSLIDVKDVIDKVDRIHHNEKNPQYFAD